jgi:hypothetical protein
MFQEIMDKSFLTTALGILMGSGMLMHGGL